MKLITLPFSCFLLLTVMFVSCKKDRPEEIIEIPIPEIIEPPTPTPEPTGQSLPLFSFAPQACTNGMAADYPCENYDLINYISLTQLGAGMANDNWGWTDPESGKEYVLEGLSNGVAFLDISSPTQVKFVGKLPTASYESVWRDIKIYQNVAYVVSEAPDHGLQVFDLTRLRNQTEFQTFEADYTQEAFGSAHNIAINEASGFAYVVGAAKNNTAQFAGGPLFYDLTNPLRPNLVGGYSASSYTHDAQIVSYNGPDADHQGKELFLGSNSDGGENNQLVIVDVTDKNNPVLISETAYGNGGYTHQGWFGEAQHYFYLGDELDEIRYGGQTKTLVFDLNDLDAPQLHHVYEGETSAIDHNGYVKGDRYFLSNYTAGFREIDISGVPDNAMHEVGYFDTYPENDTTGFDGVWNVFPFFESGIIAISDSNRGLFLVQRND